MSVSTGAELHTDISVWRYRDSAATATESSKWAWSCDCVDEGGSRGYQTVQDAAWGLWTHLSGARRRRDDLPLAAPGHPQPGSDDGPVAERAAEKLAPLHPLATGTPADGTERA